MEAETFDRMLFVAIDVEGYSKRIESEQGRVQDDLARIIAAAAAGARLPTQDWRVQQQGDGQLILAPLDRTEPRYVDEFTRQLNTELTRHNRQMVAEACLRIRVAMHHGPTSLAANGFAGNAPILVCRLRDAPVCRRVLADSDANLVLVLSSEMYRDNVLTEHTTVGPGEFTEVVIDEAKVSVRAWLWLPPGGGSETLRQARERTGRKPANRDAGPAVSQRARTITNVDQASAEVIYFGTVLRGGDHEHD